MSSPDAVNDRDRLMRVQLQIPADPNMSRVARLAAGGVCSLIGFDIEQIEDVKIAISEVILALIEHAEGNDIALTFETFRSEAHSTEPSSIATEPSSIALENAHSTTLVITGSTACSSFDGDSAELDLCRAVLAGVSQGFTISADGTRAEIRVVLPEAAA